MIDLTFALYYALLGAGVGFIAGLVGVGGGGLNVPAFTLLFTAQGIADQEVVHLALGTSMAAMIVTTFSSMRAHQRKGHINRPLAIKMVIGVTAGTLLATTIAAEVDGILLALFFSIFMLYVAFKMFQPKPVQPNANLHSTAGNIGVGGVIGTVSALVSVSGAGMIVPYLIGQNVAVKHAVGTSAAIGFPLAVTGALGYLVNGWEHTATAELTLGYIYLPAVVIFSITSYLCAPIGVACAAHLPAAHLKKALGILSLLLSVKMLAHVATLSGWI